MKKKFDFITLFIILFTCIIVASCMYLYSRDSDDKDINDKTLSFNVSSIENGQSLVKIQKVSYSYSYIYNKRFYYVFTNHGRLIIETRGLTFNSSLYGQIEENYIGKECLATVYKSIFHSDYSLDTIQCS